MNESLRVKDVENNGEKKAEGTTVRVKERRSQNAAVKRRVTNVAFRAVWENAFLKKKTRAESGKPLTGVTKQRMPSPYVYLRILFMLLAFFVLMLSVFYLFDGYELYPLLVGILVVAVPLVASVFFFEMDTSGKISLYNVLFVCFISVFAALVIEFVSIRFIYEFDGQAISLFGAMAIGLMLSIAMFSLGLIFIRQFKTGDMMSGILVGAVVGAGFAFVNNATACFREAFINTQYAPTVDIIAYNEVLRDSFNQSFGVFFFECILHSAIFVLMGASFGGLLIYTKNKGGKERSVILILALYVVTGWAFDTLWILPMPIIPDLFVYGLRSLIAVAAFLIAIRTVAVGLSENEYE